MLQKLVKEMVQVHCKRQRGPETITILRLTLVVIAATESNMMVVKCQHQSDFDLKNRMRHKGNQTAAIFN